MIVLDINREVFVSTDHVMQDNERCTGSRHVVDCMGEPDVARRVAACLNACRGMPIEDIEDLVKAGEGEAVGGVAILIVVADDARLERNRIARAGKTVLADLNARIEQAPSTAKPVFRGIAALHSAVNRAKA